MILKDYPEEVFNTTQQLLIQLQQLPDIPLSSSSAESFAPEHGVFESPKGTEGSSASAAATERVTFDFSSISNTTCSVAAAEMELPSQPVVAMRDST